MSKRKSAPRGKSSQNDDGTRRMDPSVKTTIITVIGSVITALIAYVVGPILIERIRQTPIPPPTVTITPQISMTTPSDEPVLIFIDSFENNNRGWPTGKRDEADYIVDRYIENGKYSRIMETKETSDGDIGTTPIPDVVVKNFCLIFDARISDSSGKSAISVIARPTNYGTAGASYYYLRFMDDNGTVWINPEGGSLKQIGVFDKGISWSDQAMHTVKISLQDGDLEIWDVQTNSLLQKMSLDIYGLLVSAGEIRIGTQLFGPNQKVTAEFDNMSVYDKCP